METVSTEQIKQLADHRFSEGNFHAAKSLYLQLLKRHEAIIFDVIALLQAKEDLAICYSLLGDYSQSYCLFQEVLEERLNTPSASEDEIYRAYTNLGRCCCDQDMYDTAELFLATALKGQRALFGNKHPEVLSTLSNLVRVHIHARQYDEAKDILWDIIDTCTRLGSYYPLILEANHSLGIINGLMERLEQAIAIFRWVWPRYVNQYGSMHPFALEVLHNLAYCLQWQGFGEEAQSLYSFVLDGRIQSLGEHHPYTKLTAFYLRGLS